MPTDAARIERRTTPSLANGLVAAARLARPRSPILGLHAAARVLGAVVAGARTGREARDAEGTLFEPARLLRATAITGLDRAVEALRVGLARSTPSAVVLGEAYEAALDALTPGREARRRRGVYFTPASLVAQTLDAALAGGPRLPRVCDPACGTGNFLHATLDRLARAGVERGVIARECLFGVEIDPAAAELCRIALGHAAGLKPVELSRNIRVADSLRGAPAHECAGRAHADAWVRRSGPGGPSFHWSLEFPEVFRGDRPGFDAVVGNPPFLGQLFARTAVSRARADLLSRRFDGVVRGYADVAAAFLMLAAELTRDGGRFALVLPMSLLSSRDGAPVRERLSRTSRLVTLRVDSSRRFRAGVHTCVPCFEVRAGSGGADWSGAFADAMGVPEPRVRGTGVVADMACCTADFRDQYYGLRGRIRECEGPVAPEGFAPVVTAGLIDPARCLWGLQPTRIHKRVWRAPVADVAALAADRDLAGWARARLVPKLLLATQTPVLEVVADERGRWLPSVPVITIVPKDPSRLWHVGAVISSPVANATAARLGAGAALTPHAIKLSASQTAALPTPAPGPEWDRAADLFRAACDASDDGERRALLRGAAAAMDQAFGVRGDNLLDWWYGRLGD